MPLAKLPPDPAPTDEELATIRGVPVASLTVGDYIFGEMEWQRLSQERDPNAFLVRYATDATNFGWSLDYRDYLKSKEWKKIRKRVLESADYLCAGCGGTASAVHHRDYRPRVLIGEDDAPLIPLCSECHDAIHIDNKAADAWDKAEAALAALIAMNEAKISNLDTTLVAGRLYLEQQNRSVQSNDDSSSSAERRSR
jgi:hypothetical protein